MVDTDGHELGTVTAVEANPASDLLVLDGGGLIPLRFVVEGGAAPGTWRRPSPAMTWALVDWRPNETRLTPAWQ